MEFEKHRAALLHDTVKRLLWRLMRREQCEMRGKDKQKQVGWGGCRVNEKEKDDNCNNKTVRSATNAT